ncbi:MAG: hypothetical protein IKG22_04585 [Atopobiaceae bacterium]|nr:hypothetical protein [Atopobiaceae bacterium]
MGLFKPAWMSKNQARALASVEAMEDEATLRRVVAEAPLENVRIRAAVKIDDQELYKHYARLEADSHLGYAMAMRIDDIDFLWEFIRRESCTGVVLSNIRDRIDTLTAKKRDAENRKKLAEIPSLNDIARLVDIATSDHRQDVGCFDQVRVYGAPTPRSTEDNMREAAIERLAELGADDALIEVAHDQNATLSNTAEKAVAKITDQRKLFQLASDDTLGWHARKAAVDALSDRALLDQLTKMTSQHGPLELPIEKAAEERIQQIRSEELCHGEHDWELTGLEYGGLGEYAYYRCKRCGIERHEVNRY